MANLAELFVLSRCENTKEEIIKEIEIETGAKIVDKDDILSTYLQNRWTIGDFDSVLKSHKNDDFLIIEEIEGYEVHLYGPNFHKEIFKVIYPGDIDDLQENLDDLEESFKFSKKAIKNFKDVLNKEDKAIYFSDTPIASKYLKEVFGNKDCSLFAYILHDILDVIVKNLQKDNFIIDIEESFIDNEGVEYEEFIGAPINQEQQKFLNRILGVPKDTIVIGTCDFPEITKWETVYNWNFCCIPKNSKTVQGIKKFFEELINIDLENNLNLEIDCIQDELSEYAMTHQFNFNKLDWLVEFSKANENKDTELIKKIRLLEEIMKIKRDKLTSEYKGYEIGIIKSAKK